jgi:hypothetical protein
MEIVDRGARHPPTCLSWGAIHTGVGFMAYWPWGSVPMVCTSEEWWLYLCVYYVVGASTT